jgi:hypothetical protein
MSIGAMKQALEALESATPKYTRQRADQKTLGGALDYWKLEQHQRLKAITSLRQAIAEAKKQEQGEKLAELGWQEIDCPICGGGARVFPKQEQGEPVAVWELFADGWDSIADPEWMESLPVGTKLYHTTPPQRNPLTAEEIAKLDCYDHFKFARAIEAAHGIK